MGTSRRRRLLAVLGMSAAIAVWIVAVVVSASTARDELEEAMFRLGDARRELRTLDVEAARAPLDDASVLVRSAHRRVHQPHVTVASWVPFAGNSLSTGRAVAEAARDITDRVLEVADALGELPGGADALQPRDGRIPTEPWAVLAPPLRQAAAVVADARSRVEDSPSTWLHADAREGREQLLALVEEVLPQLESAAAVTAQLPSLLGAQTPRRYLLLAANPAELRGTGGFLGAYAVATIDDGRLDIGGFRPIWELDNGAPGTAEAPDEQFEARYGRYGGTWSWLNQNLSPDFPSTATMIERLWVATGNEPVDGSVLVDPFAFEALVRLAGQGGVEIEETGEVVRPATIVEYITNGAYRDLDDPTERKEIIGAVAASTLGRFLRSGLSTDARTLRLLGAMFAGRHVVVHAADEDVQDALVRAGIAGTLPNPERGVFLNVTLNSATASKVDHWLDRTVRAEVTPLADGAADVVVEVELHNGAPTSGEPSRAIGPNTPELEAGENRLWVSVYCSSRCRFDAADPGTQGGSRVERELGMPVASSWVDIPSGETVTLRYRMTVADAWYVLAGGAEVAFHVHDQATVRAGTTDLSVNVPASWTLDTGWEQHPDTATVDGDRVRIVQQERGDVREVLRFGL